MARTKSWVKKGEMKRLWLLCIPSILLLECSFLVAQTASVPLYRLVNGGDHFYTADCSEKNQAVTKFHYSFEGVQAYIFPSASAQIVPFYRLANGPWHFYTADPAEEQQVLKNGWKLEGVVGYVANAQLSGLVPLYRASFPGAGHFYTTNAQEWNLAISRGWVAEGVAGYVLGKTDNPCIGPSTPSVAPSSTSPPGEHSDNYCAALVEVCYKYHFDGNGNKVRDGIPYPCGVCVGWSF